jgi:hypothetical protein
MNSLKNCSHIKGNINTKVLIKIFFAVHMKHSSLRLSADVKPIKNDLVIAMPYPITIKIDH